MGSGGAWVDVKTFPVTVTQTQRPGFSQDEVCGVGDVSVLPPGCPLTKTCVLFPVFMQWWGAVTSGLLEFVLDSPLFGMARAGVKQTLSAAGPGVLALHLIGRVPRPSPVSFVLCSL